MRPAATPPHCRAAVLGLIAALGALLPGHADAHIKWFADYDVTQPPRPIAEVMNAQFLLVLCGFALLMVGGVLLDRLAVRLGRRPAQPRLEAATETLLRAALGGFFMAIFAMGGVILTPELRTEATWPAWLQLAIAASMVSARSCALGGIGILVLYGYGVAQYGLFHLSDYPIFLGLAAYLMLTSTTAVRLRALRMPIVYAAVCITLMWGSVEKWAYPGWTYPLLAQRPYLTLGLPADRFMVLAGFVEFALPFYILTGLGLLRLAIAGLGGIFLLAIVDFGRLDAIGHLPIIASLAAMFLHGPTPLHRALHDPRRGGVAEARRAGLAFVGTLALFVIGYYGVQREEYGRPAPHLVATMAGGMADTLR